MLIYKGWGSSNSQLCPRSSSLRRFTFNFRCKIWTDARSRIWKRFSIWTCWNHPSTPKFPLGKGWVHPKRSKIWLRNCSIWGQSQPKRDWFQDHPKWGPLKSHPTGVTWSHHATQVKSEISPPTSNNPNPHQSLSVTGVLSKSSQMTLRIVSMRTWISRQWSSKNRGRGSQKSTEAGWTFYNNRDKVFRHWMVSDCSSQ